MVYMVLPAWCGVLPYQQHKDWVTAWAVADGADDTLSSREEMLDLVATCQCLPLLMNMIYQAHV